MGSFELWSLIVEVATVAVAMTAAAASPDLNGDGRIDRKDHELLASAIAEGRYLASYDLDGNGELDTVDLNRLLDDTQYNAFVTVNGVTFKMVAVEGGTFTMGATSEQCSDAYDNEKPAHQVTLNNYCIGQTEVTEGLWLAVMGTSPGGYKGVDYPVSGVSWDDCKTFISKLNSMTGETFRLPTEAEWEFAARGGNKSKGYKYPGGNNLSTIAWYWQNSGNLWLSGEWEKTKVDNNNCGKHSVASMLPNELGIYDMGGNLSEWCADWYGEYSSRDQTNPKGPSTGTERVIRGINYYWSNVLDHYVSYRYKEKPSAKYGNYGFRLAK